MRSKLLWWTLVVTISIGLSKIRKLTQVKINLVPQMSLVGETRGMQKYDTGIAYNSGTKSKGNTGKEILA